MLLDCHKQVTAVAQAGRSDRARYVLTPEAAAFFPVIALLITWGQRWFRAPEGPAIVLTHTPCGAPLEPTLPCDRCGKGLRASDVVVEEDGR